MRVRVASAGTGKTTALVARVVQLVDEGVPLRRIAGVTYTRTAAAELRQRVGEGVAQVLADGAYLGGLVAPDPAHRPRFEEARRELGGATLTTIHGFLIAALRLVAPALALDPAFALQGEAEAAAAYEEEVRSLLFLAQDPSHPLAAAAARLGPEAADRALALFVRRSAAVDLRPADEAADDLLRLHAAAYDRALRRAGAARLAPSEVERAAMRFVDAPALAARVVARYPVVLVDEYQDVNPLQGRLFEALERVGARVEVVGDPKQSIYGFRLADVAVFRRAAAAAAAAGTLDPPLDRTRRHARAVAAFLNHLTGTLGDADLGFARAEAPDVAPAGAQAEVEGRVELHWWRDDDLGLDALRPAEEAWLGERLRRLRDEDGHGWRDMAVVARSHARLGHVARALRAAGVPTVLRQGRGYFERPEVRDLVHAVRVALDPSGTSLAAWLRGPFGDAGVRFAADVARAADPAGALATRAPNLFARLEASRAAVAADPGAAVATLAYAPLIDGAPYVARLDRRARDNVDALVVALAERPVDDVERLLDRMEAMAREAEAGDVPQGGDGVTLLTVHAAKGLEWPVVALVDVGGAGGGRGAAVAIDGATGVVAVPGTPRFDELEVERRQRAEGESMRALYVAASRPRTVLLLSGVQGRSAPGPWLRALHRAGLGPRGVEREAGWPVARALGALVVQHPVAGASGAPRAAPEAPVAPWPAAPWLGRVPRASRYPAVVSPSWVVLEGAGRAPEPPVRAPWPAPLHAPGGWGEGEEVDDDRRAGDPEEGEVLAGRGTAVGTLVHDAIARGWRADDPAARAALAVQEVLFPFPDAVRVEVLDEVAELIHGYWRLVDGGVLAPSTARDEDHAELPFAFEAGGSTWYGVIDRLVRVGDGWWLDDYKTDRALRPERYLVAMATYVEAVARARGVRPQARLVDVRRGEVVALDDGELAAAWARTLAGPGDPVGGARGLRR